MTVIKRPEGTSAYISYDPSDRSSITMIRSNDASTSSADRLWAAIFARFHGIHLNSRIVRIASSTRSEPNVRYWCGQYLSK